MWSFLLHILGVDNVSGPWYGFWSGFGSDLSEFAILGGVISVFRTHNCHVKGCWRLARHDILGTPYTVCRRHHPDVPDGGLTHDHIRQAAK